MLHTQTPRDTTNQYGFTLVELAVSLTIIGLLLAGILRGRELLDHARATSTIQQFRDYKAALNTFSNMYDAIPGDMLDPGTRLPDCISATCATAGNSDRFVNPVLGSPSVGVTVSFYITQPETRQFWLHMQKAGLISAVDPDGTMASPMQFGREIPEVALQTGGWLAHTLQPIAPYQLVKKLAITISSPETSRPVKAAIAVMIDEKIDDGKPYSGFVVAPSDCASDTTVNARYIGSTVTARCDLSFMLN